MEKKRLIFFIISFLIIFGVIFFPGYTQLQKLQEENAEHKKRIQFLQEHNDVLEEELDNMKEDPDYVERKAREKLGIVKKGEVIYRSKSE